MARIVEKNPRFRTKRRIAEDVAFVLNAPLSWGTQYAVIAETLWVWSEFDGKYKGCKYWSERAWARRDDKTKMLRHDHAVPKKILIAELRKLSGTATPDQIERLLGSYCIGVVITKEEDDLLNDNGHRSTLPGEELDPWARYRKAGIVLRANRMGA
jgi:hypothetical protein